MKFTIGWLKDHLDTDADLATIADKLTMLGLEVEGIEDPAAKLADFSVARVVSAEQHPNADKLRLCQVEALVGGELETLQVVCGAPNAREGLVGIFAPEGSTIPANGMVLKPTEIRGVKSNGMLCSERELELSDEHDGIIELDVDFEVGTPAAEALGLNDPVIEIAITPNRPDCLGVRGIARDLAAAGLGTLKPEATPDIKGKGASPVGIFLDFDAETADACPIFAGRLIKGVANGPSPLWMQKRLTAIGLRPINALVDITNYLTYDLNRPLHVYDAAKLSGDIGARLGRGGESLEALDGKTYEIDTDMCVIADGARVLGLGGVMGGEASGSTESTTDVFVESAYFDPYRTARTGRRTGIVSDARYRFERGIDPASAAHGLDIATQMIMDICGGEPSKPVVAGTVPEAAAPISFDPKEVRRLTGVDLSPTHAAMHLQALGFRTEAKLGDTYLVHAPSWRPDVHGAADLVEEVVRVHGLDEVVSTPLPRAHGVSEPVLSLVQQRGRIARRVLATRGLLEAVTWSFVSEKEAALFGGGDQADLLTLENPLTVDQVQMRPTLISGLLGALGRNVARGYGDLALFEIGQIFLGDGPEDQKTAIATVRQGTARPQGRGRHWQGAVGAVSAYDVKEDAMAVLAALGAPVDSLQIVAEPPDWLHPGRGARIQLGPKTVLGVFGELHPRLLDELDLKGPIVAMELYPEAIPAPKAKATKAKPPLELSDLQPVRRDFAFIVGSEIAAGDLIRAAKGAEKKLVGDVKVFDRFEGSDLGDGEVSLAIEVTLLPKEKTLTDEDLEAASARIVAAVEKATGGRLRG